MRVVHLGRSTCHATSILPVWRLELNVEVGCYDVVEFFREISWMKFGNENTADLIYSGFGI